MDLSIVIVSHNGRELLRRCLRTVYEHSPAGAEVTIVDNASTDGAPAMVATEFPSVRLLRQSTNEGFAHGVNAGFAAAPGSYVLLLNPDTELSMDIAIPMLAYLRQHPDVGILAPKIFEADGSVQLSCRRFPDLSTALFNRYSLLTRALRNNPASQRYLMTDFAHDRTADVDWVSAACWLVPRAAYERIGPLDDGYFWSIEDVDYCQRAHRAGLRVVYFPDVSIRHHIGGSSQSQPARTIRERHKGMWRYYTTYMRPASPLVRPVVDASVWAGIQTRCTVHLASSGLRRRLRPASPREA